jgi:pyridinium-3,5-bisthiocarboxylic acid mononucleotide nickel chelatase
VTLAHIEPISGASGDMLLGALLDAGADLPTVRGIIDGLEVPGWTLEVEEVRRTGIGATHAVVRTEESGVVRTWANVRALLSRGALPEPVRARALATFSRLAAAEARIHRIAPDRVHFHEVGAVDAIVDIVGVCAALHVLGVTHVTCAPVPQGVGMTRAAHGMIPIPAPAVLELLRGAPTYSTGLPVELCTPTGAALLVEWTDTWRELPPMTVRATGYGAGTRELERPNVLRVVLGDPAEVRGGRPTLVLETTIDDMAGELIPPVLDALRAAGASDAWVRPVLMKKGRPGHEITCISDPDAGEALRRILFRETTTLGIRGHLEDKWVLERSHAEVQVAGAAIRLKLGHLDGRVVNVAPEFEDCADAARATGLPLKEVYARARGAWRAANSADGPPPDERSPA